MSYNQQETSSVLNTLESLSNEAIAKISAASLSSTLNAIDTEYLGRKGSITGLLRRIGELPKDERPGFGQKVNAVKDKILQLIASKRQELEIIESENKLKVETIDITLPGRYYRIGRKHPLTSVMNETSNIFIGMGYEIVDGPEAEHYNYNFETLNYPTDHPAMDAQMSFYITDDIILRTQTTALQGHVMERRKPPFRICTIGRCFRLDDVDATHSHTFHQVDCFTIDEGIRMSDLKGTLTQFSAEMFGEDTKVRFRPDYFPFVEPGAEWAISCFVCKGEGCGLCKGSGWIELGGAGMIHPNILNRFGYDTERYSGFAFGMGIERITMLKHGIDDLRLFLENDIRFLRMF